LRFDETVILFVPSFGQPIFRVPAAGGSPAPLTKIDASKESAHELPRFLPDGQHYLYFVRSAKRDIQGIYVGSLDASGNVRLLDGDTAAEYAAPGYLLFAREGAMLAQPFDASTRRLSGEAMTAAPTVEIVEDFNKGLFNVSPARKLMSVSIGYRPSFEAATPKALFDLDQVTDYAISRDGRRFPVNRIISDPRSEPLTVVLNWTAALKK
jgi:hypothetical protein